MVDLIYTWAKFIDQLLIIYFWLVSRGFGFELLRFDVLSHFGGAVAGFADGS